MRLRIEWEIGGQDGAVTGTQPDIIHDTEGDLNIPAVVRVVVANLPAWLVEALHVAIEDHEMRVGP